jgi:hypothetical protein
MKKILIIFLLLSAVTLAGLTYNAEYYRKHIQSALSGSTTADPFYLAFAEIETSLEGTSGIDAVYLTPGTAPATPAEGQVYYDATGDVLKFRNASTWVTLASSGSATLDEAYDAGNGITVDGSAVTLTVTDAANNSALSIVHQEATNDNDAFTIANSADAAGAVSIQIDGTAGYDIQGTGDTWNVSIAGTATFVGVTTTGELDVTAADILATGASYDMAWDTSRNQLIFQDNAVLGLGGAHDAAADITFVYNGTDLLMEAAAADDLWKIGYTTNFDIGIYGDTNTDLVYFDTSAELVYLDGFDMRFNDGDFLKFGDDSDFTMTSGSAATLTIATAASDESPIINAGADQSGIDLKLFGATTGAYFLWDASGDEILVDKASISLGDSDALLFGDTLGTGDFSISDISDVLTIDVVSAGTGEIAIGNDGDDVPMKWYAETGSDWVYFNADEVEFEDVVLQMMDSTQIQFGDGDDWYITSGTAKTLDIIPGATTDETAIINIGADTAGADLKLFGATTAEYLLWDASGDDLIGNYDTTLFTQTGAAANQFKVDATGTVAGYAIVLETTDGGVQVNADGAANGDIMLDAADDVTLTAGDDLVLAVTGNVTGNIAGDGSDTLMGYLRAVEVEPDTSETVLVTDSGKVFVNTAAAGATTYTLPGAAAGLTFTFIDNSATAGDDVIIDCDALDNIDHDTDGDAIQNVSDEASASITLVAIDATTWITVSKNGTWGQQ